MEIGINLFSVNEALNEDYLKTLERVAACGYRNVELIATNKYGDRFSDSIPLPVLKKKLAELGLNPIAAHEGIRPGVKLNEMDWDYIINYNIELGINRIVMPILRIDTIQDTLATAEQLNKLGSKCRKKGIQLYIHNHALEFKKVNDTTLFHLLVENTEPSNLKVELDLAWVIRGGSDPVAVLKWLGERCDLIHQRDLKKHINHPLHIFDELTEADKELTYQDVHMKYRRPELFVDLGTGSFDFEDVYTTIKQLGYVKYAIVESDGEREDKFGSIANDLNYLKRYI
ncbi:sugar phosphate isomerase/epimerase family protein [Paenibacillus aestuarii]|uniref:Sugar phosphate isomerase/epimerase family protein n=1 Tax=Paenibacillus aestuarii TaxID=516965 RepID=A0ABW0K7H8_9BACL|nr:sugar phosphate isomerase/epimerase [Paenibacillus aestuarii]